jgi:predicted dehydrogenase
MARAEATRADGIDAVAIVTPNHLHAPVAEAFLAEGIDVVCDKPLTATLAEAEALAAAQRRSGCVFAVTYAYASHAMVRQAREMVLAGDIGELRQVHVEYFQDWAIDLTDQGGDTAPDRPWRLDPARGGATFTVADIGTHAAHLAEFASGRQIASLRADFHVTGAPKALEDTAFMTLRMDGGAVGTLMVSQALAGSQCGLRLRLAGTRATLEWHQETPEVLHLRPVEAPAQVLTRGHGAGIKPAIERLVRMKRGHPEALSDAWANLYLEVAVAVEARRDGRPLPPGLVQVPTVEDGLRGMHFVDAATRSAASGQGVTLPPG